MSNLWIFTPDGFYSSRQDEWCEDDEVMVRARVYEDLLGLADQLGMEDPEIIRISKGDYLYRMKVKQSDWSVYCAHAALNHSDEGGIKDTEDIDRYLAYLRIWEIMCTLQNLKDAEKRGNKKEIDLMRDWFDDMVFPDYTHYESKYPEVKSIYGEQITKKKRKKKKKRNRQKIRIEDYNDDPFYFERRMRERMIK